MEWEMLVRAAMDLCQQQPSNKSELPFECLEEIHIFVLANILRRPIIVLSEAVVRNLRGSALGPNNFGGIYLPLLWKPAQCVGYPIVLGFNVGHFVPLLGSSSSDVTERDHRSEMRLAEHVVPLVTHKLEPVHVHFLLAGEERYVHKLLHDYLKITEVNWTKSEGVQLVLAARLDPEKIPDRYDLMVDLVQQTEQYFYHNNINRDIRSTDPQASVMIPAEKTLKDKVISPVMKKGDKARTHVGDVPAQTYLIPGKDLGKHGKDVQTDSRRCITTGCEFYGSSETGWMCSGCLKKHLEEVGHAEEETYSLQPIPSVTDIKCAYAGCRYQASRFTTPYCHEHFTGADSRQNVENMVKEQQASSETVSPVVRQTLGEAVAPSYSMGQSTPCKQPGCPLFGLQEWGYYCMQHMLLQEQTRAEDKLTEEMCAQAQSEVNLQSKKPNDFDRTKSEKRPAKNPCISPACNRLADDRYQGWCLLCHEYQKLRGYDIDRLAQPTGESSSQPHLGKQTQNRASRPKSTSEVEPMCWGASRDLDTHEERTCIAPRCRREGLAEYKGLCSECFTLLERRPSPETENVKVPEHKGSYMCLKTAYEGVVLLTCLTGQHSIVCHKKSVAGCVREVVVQYM